MHTQVYRKALFHFSLLGIAASVFVGFFDEIISHLLEFAHFLFEVVETGLDKLVEHFFETSLQTTQMIVFYLMMLIIGLLIYFTWKTLVQLCSGAGYGFLHEWREIKDAVVTDWQNMSVMNRIIVVTVFLLVNYLASFLLF